MPNKLNTFIAYVGLICFLFMVIYNNRPLPPTPAEYIQKKKDRKIHKKYRKEYFEKMHKSAPDIDWKRMNQSYREKRSSLITNKRNSLSIDLFDNYQESFFRRELEGQWQERGSNNLAGRVHTVEVDFDQGMIYCGSSGGNIWKGSILGEGWVSVNDYMQIDNINMIRLIPNGNNNRLLISGGNKFYYSDNEGFTLNQATGLEGVQSWGEIYRSVVTYFDDELAPIVYVLTKEWSNGSVIRIFKSDDLGESFYQIYSTPLLSERAYDIWTDRYLLSDIYFLRNGELYSIDLDVDGISLIGSAGPSNQGENIISGGRANNSFTYHFYSKIGDRLYFSNDGGENWSNQGELPSYTFMRNSFNGSYQNPGIITIGGIEAYKSLNYGGDWNKVNNWWDYYGDNSSYLHADIPEIRFLINDSGNEIVFISTDGGLYISDQSLSEVDNLSLNGLGVSQYYSTYTQRSQPYQVFAGSQDQGFQRSINQFNSVYDFEQVISGDYGHLVSGDGGYSIWSVYPGFAMYYPNASTNTGGITWDFQMSGNLWLPPLMEDPYNPSSTYIAGGGLSGGNHIIKLTRLGSSIQVNEGDYNFNNTITAMAYSPINPSYRYALTYNGSFYHSTDDGINWSMSPGFSGPESHYFYGSKILPSNETLGMVIIAGSGYSNPPVFISNNHGSTFTSMSNGMPSTLVYDLASTESDNYIFAATAVGAFAYSFEEQEWVDIMGVSAPDQTYWTVEYIPEIYTARFGTYGRGIWDFIVSEDIDIMLGDLNEDSVINIQDVIILVNISLSEIIPTDYHLIAGDINEDDTIDILDIISCINFILNN